jgi:FtsH-binding integral membrane protein
MATGEMIQLPKKAQERVEQRSLENSPGNILSDRMYNLVLGACVCWGLGVNVIMCATMSDLAVTIVGKYGLAFIIAYLVLAIAGIVLAHKSKNPLISFIGYNMVVIPLGIEISAIVAVYGGMDTMWVQQAFLDTMLITIAMVCLSMLFPQFFSKIGGILLACLLGIIVVSIITMFLGGNSLWLSVVTAVVFSLYIGYDYWVAQQYAKTLDNAVDSAIDLYMDIALLFLQLVRIFGNSK